MSGFTEDCESVRSVIAGSPVLSTELRPMYNFWSFGSDLPSGRVVANMVLHAVAMDGTDVSLRPPYWPVLPIADYSIVRSMQMPGSMVSQWPSNRDLLCPIGSTKSGLLVIPSTQPLEYRLQTPPGQLVSLLVSIWPLRRVKQRYIWSTPNFDM